MASFYLFIYEATYFHSHKKFNKTEERKLNNTIYDESEDIFNTK
jgi:hypothetical protein